MLALFYVSLALRLARFMALLNLSFVLNRIYSSPSLILERGMCSLGGGEEGRAKKNVT